MQTRTELLRDRLAEIVALTQKNAEEKHLLVGERPLKAGQLVFAGKVTRLGPELYEVESGEKRGTVYKVNGVCSCPDGAKAPGNWCKHRLAGRFFDIIEKDVRRLREAHVPHTHRYVCSQHTIPEVDCWQLACPDPVEIPCPICAKETPNVPPHIEAIIAEEGVPVQTFIVEPVTSVEDEQVNAITGEITEESEAPYPVIASAETGDTTETPFPEEEPEMMSSIKATVEKVIASVTPNGVSNGLHAEPEAVQPLATTEYEPAPVLAPRQAAMPEASVSVCFTIKLPDNNQVTYTLRGHTDAEVLARIPIVLAGLEHAITPEAGRLSWLRRIFTATFPPRDREDVSGK
jgi:hypothetical protein